MIRYVTRRLLGSLPTLLAVLTLVFVLLRIIPGDPAVAMLGDQANPQTLSALRQRLGVDRPLGEQYVAFVLGIARGDWGLSMVSGRPVLSEIADVLPHTVDLTLAAILLGCAVGIPLGVWSAIRRNSLVDFATRVVSLFGLSFPAFVSGILLLLAFAIQFRWFPVISAGKLDDPVDRLRNLVLPAVNLGVIMVAYITRVTRSSMLEVLGEDYVRTARAKGAPERTVLVRHALRNALIPIVTVVGLYLGILIGNSALTEIVFNRPGLGKLIVGALNQRDYTLIQGLLVIYALLIVVVNLATDLAYGLIDPRVRRT